MRILAVDTSTPSGSVALVADGVLRAEINIESPSTHSSRLLRSIDFVLQAAGLVIAEVDAYAVAAGPGSFTGIRIGLSAVKSLAFASGKPVVPVSTLRALATKVASPRARLACPLLDAKKGEIYAALFEARDKGLAEIVPQGAYLPDTFLALLPRRRVISLLGSGLSIVAAKARARLGDRALFPSRSSHIAAEVALLGARELEEGRGTSARELEPIYFRKSQAEEKGVS